MELKGKGILMGNNHKPKEVLIFGAGSFGEEVLDFLDDINCIHPTYRCIGFLDDEEKKWGGKLHGVPILGAFSESNKFPNSQLVLAFTSIKNFWNRETIFSSIEKRLNRFETIVHPSAMVSKTALIGKGTVIYPNVTIRSNASIGNHVVVLPNSVVSHDVRIEDYSIIASGVNIAGRTTIGSCCYLGSGCSIRENLTIEDYCLIGMGSVVLTHVARNCVMVGNPARKIRTVVES